MKAASQIPAQHVVIDQMGRSVQVPVNPQRVVSLVPSQTELLFDLGLAERIAGVTRYCLHPPHALTACADIGGTKRLRLQAIEALAPDLIIGNKEENDRESIEALAGRYPVWMSDIYTFEDALTMIGQVAGLMGVAARGEALNQQIRQDWQALPDGRQISVAYLIWKKPYMACGNNTFIQAVLDQLNLVNVFADRDRYPEIDVQALQEAQPDWLLLSSEPFPFNDEHVAELAAQLPGTRVTLVDGEMFSWYGSRLALAPAYFQSLMSRLMSGLLTKSQHRTVP